MRDRLTPPRIEIWYSPEADVFVSKDTELDLLSQGTTPEQALAAILGARKLYIEHMDRRGWPGRDPISE